MTGSPAHDDATAPSPGGAAGPATYPVVTGLRLHPVKSTAIRSVDSARVGPAGLAGDREWMVVDAAGALVSARECPRLFAVVADCPATDPTLDAGLRMRASGAPDLLLAVPRDGALVPASLFGRPPLPARAAGPGADAWLRAVLDRPDVRLVWCADPAARTLNPERFGADEHAAFQDGCPVSVIGSASVTAVREAGAADALAHDALTPDVRTPDVGTPHVRGPGASVAPEVVELTRLAGSPEASLADPARWLEAAAANLAART